MGGLAASKPFMEMLGDRKNICTWTTPTTTPAGTASVIRLKLWAIPFAPIPDLRLNRSVYCFTVQLSEFSLRIHTRGLELSIFMTEESRKEKCKGKTNRSVLKRSLPLIISMVPSLHFLCCLYTASKSLSEEVFFPTGIILHLRLLWDEVPSSLVYS